MKLVCSVCLIFHIIPFCAPCQNPEKLFKEGNRYYREQEYFKAISMYDSLVDLGYESTNLYFNLGNAWFKSDSISRAILYYEKAKKLAGNREDIHFNLKLARQRIPDKIEPLPRLFLLRWWDQLLYLTNTRSWALISLAFLWLGFISGSAFIFTKQGSLRRIYFIAGLLFLFLFLTVGLISYSRYRTETGQRNGIVLATSVYVKSAPDESSTDLFVIHEGVKVRVMDQVGEWREIRLADGKVGWIKKRSFRRI